ncbi:hypothetical protein HDF16_001360 [Granulicella aggregans]|uniref:Uncharacterized protein n=1 Tax=Granulicella aggregans TaxID=474949 RepID=A0A7W8E404_9BACT|nr:hypothetical protein [Granulicella aggregans]
MWGRLCDSGGVIRGGEDGDAGVSPLRRDDAAASVEMTVFFQPALLWFGRRFQSGASVPTHRDEAAMDGAPDSMYRDPQKTEADPPPATKDDK